MLIKTQQDEGTDTIALLMTKCMLNQNIISHTNQMKQFPVCFKQQRKKNYRNFFYLQNQK